MAPTAGSGSAPRVLHVMECTIGGTRRHLVDVAQGLLERGIDLHLAVAVERAPDFRADLERLARRGCGVHELAMVRELSPGRDARHLLALERLLARLAPDVVHTHSSKAGVLGRLASLATGIGRRVHTPHSMAFLFREMFGPLRRHLFFQLERHLAAQTDQVIAVSAGEAATLRAAGVVDGARLAVVPNGIDPAPFAGAAPIDLAALGLDPARPTAAVVGLLNVAKGQDLALEAAALCPTLQLLVVGEGGTRAELEDLARRLGIAARVRFLGFRRDVPAILAAADLALLPSRWEGLPYAALEAMAAARPVLATPVDGARDVIEHGLDGWLAADVSAAALARSLAAALALSPAERRAAGERGRERVRQRFTRAKMVEGLLAVYAELV